MSEQQQDRQQQQPAVERVSRETMLRWLHENSHEAQELWLALQRLPQYRHMEEKCRRDGRKRRRADEERAPGAEPAQGSEDSTRTRSQSLWPQLQRKIYLPVDKYPGYNLAMIIIGPKGSTQKALEKATRCKIMLRGKGSVKGADPSPFEEDLHVLITGQREEDVEHAVQEVEKLLPIIAPKKQLGEFVQTNDKRRVDDVCYACGDHGHWEVDCPYRGDSPADAGILRCGVSDGHRPPQDSVQEYNSSAETISDKFESTHRQNGIASDASQSTKTNTSAREHQQPALAPNGQLLPNEQHTARGASFAVGRGGSHPAEPFAQGFARSQEVQQSVASRHVVYQGPYHLREPFHGACFSPSYQAGFAAGALQLHVTGKSPSMEGKIPMADLEFGPVLGQGSFGVVYTEFWHNRRVAVKKFAPQQMNPGVVANFESEVRILRSVNHPNVCRLFGVCVDPENLGIVLEFVERGSLWRVLRFEWNKMDSATQFKMVMDVACGMAYLHSFERPILHRDLKSPNLLVARDMTVKIADFGMARVMAHSPFMTRNCGTTHWMAPEMLAGSEYTERADVYSFGVVMWEIFTGQCPYENMPEDTVRQRVLHHGSRPDMSASIPDGFAPLMETCWHSDPSRRPTFAGIVRILHDLDYTTRTQV